jgi:hypothetical protein
VPTSQPATAAPAPSPVPVATGHPTAKVTSHRPAAASGASTARAHQPRVALTAGHVALGLFEALVALGLLASLAFGFLRLRPRQPRLV